MTTQTVENLRSKRVMKPKQILGEIDLVGGVLPITRAAAGLAEVIRQARESKTPVIVTQNGYSTAVIMDIQSYKTMRKLAEERLEQMIASGENISDELLNGASDG